METKNEGRQKAARAATHSAGGGVRSGWASRPVCTGNRDHASSRIPLHGADQSLSQALGLPCLLCWAPPPARPLVATSATPPPIHLRKGRACATELVARGAKTRK